MECPKCDYEPTMAEQTANPGICPSCGVVYAKVKAQQAARSAEPRGYSVLDRMNMGLVGAQAEVKAGRERRAEQELDHHPLNSVEVTAIRIPFLSLVWLMTKVILAALPAIILAGAILIMLGSFIGGMVRALTF